MTHDEETMLKRYLRLDAHAFEDWLRSTRGRERRRRARVQGGPCRSAGLGARVHGRREGLRRVGGGTRGLGAGRRSP